MINSDDQGVRVLTSPQSDTKPLINPNPADLGTERPLEEPKSSKISLRLVDHEVGGAKTDRQCRQLH
ncbi:hypothetical protein, partial [Micromonospora sp. NBS 11-29]|uniref:hypothetical protein n=1 Tax=Micromonospora sp. NBS 11-29 TaxID=1960879 RepID=UPI001C38E3C7